MKSIKQYILESQLKPNSFCILKPGFLEYEKEWLDMLQGEGWNILKQKNIKMSKELASDMYKMHKDKDFYNDLCDYMSSDNCLCCICYKNCADPIKDMDKLKDKIRKKWGKDDMKNVMHSSDSLNNVNRENKLIFD